MYLHFTSNITKELKKYCIKRVKINKKHYLCAMNTKLIVKEESFIKICSNFKGCAVYASITDTEYNEQLWLLIAEATAKLRNDFTIDTVKERNGIKATREAYKACGKDPSRYRPSNEQLCRRLLQGKDLYRVTTVVDLINLASIEYGYSIGGFDADLIDGSVVTLGIGKEGEDYEGIGRGKLNIAGMPVYRDAKGGIGTPTSDNERTKLSLDTKHLLCLINGYDGNRETVKGCAEMLASLLVKYAGAKSEDIVLQEY